jgi:hypothetical protein
MVGKRSEGVKGKVACWHTGTPLLASHDHSHLSDDVKALS